MINLFGILLLSLLVITALAIVRTKDLFSAVMLTAIFSLLMAVNFFLLDAADVALTEAAIGAGITMVIFLSALSLTVDREKPRTYSRRAGFIVVVVTALTVIYATLDKPPLGDPDAPVHQHVAPYYIEKTPELMGFPNVVTAVLASFRGYDTLGEVFVVFTACIGVLFVLDARRGLGDMYGRRGKAGLQHHHIPQNVGQLLVPLVILFGLYVQFHGEYSAGGGFQAGAIIATGVILYALLEGENASLAAIPRTALMALMVGGASLYGFVGVACMLLGGNYLDYSVLADDPVLGQQIGIMLIEVGVGMAVCGGLLSIFHAFAARKHTR